MLKKLTAMGLLMVMVFSMMSSVLAAEIMPLAGNECPYCGNDGYERHELYSDWGWDYLDGGCRHGHPDYRDKLYSRTLSFRYVCGICGYNSTGSWNEYATQSYVYCPATGYTGPIKTEYKNI